MIPFSHPLFAGGSWCGCTTESLRWTDPDYDETAGKVGVQPTTQPDSSRHLFFVDLAVRTNDGREIVLERIEGGKLLDALIEAQYAAQDAKDRSDTIVYSLRRDPA